MRDLKRNQTEFWYCLLIPNTQEAIVDEYGNETGELIPSYKKAISMRANISPATGQNQVEQFGNLDSYDKVIVTCDMKCPIDENSVLFIDKRPEYTEVQTHEIVEGQVIGWNGGEKKFDFVKTRADAYNATYLKKTHSFTLSKQEIEDITMRRIWTARRRNFANVWQTWGQ